MVLEEYAILNSQQNVGFKNDLVATLKKCKFYGK